MDEVFKLSAAQLTERQKRKQLRFAIQDQNTLRIEEILATGYDVSSRPPHSTSTWLGEAIRSGGNSAILEILLAAGCDPNSGTKSPDNTAPLQVAVSKQQLSTIEWLLRNGASPNIGRPIVGAINFEIAPATQLKMLTLLLVAGANINKTFALYGDENDRFTVLDWAILYDLSPTVIEFLESHGAEHNYGTDQMQNMKNNLKTRRIV